MTAERARAYGRVIQTLDNLGATKLQADEQQRVRHAADALILTRDLAKDAEARAALEDVMRLGHRLVESGRWHRATAAQLVDDIAECGPPLLPELEAA
jgi:hypothetical protein